MAIDATGKPTTTGMMDSRPKVPKAPNLSNLGKADKKVSPSPQPVTEKKADPIQDELANRLKKLTAEDNAALDSALSPSVRKAIGKILPEVKPLMDRFGSNEPNVIIPLSVAKTFAIKRYGGDENQAVKSFMSDMLADMEQPMEQQTTVPPSQGIMTSPQTT